MAYTDKYLQYILYLHSSTNLADLGVRLARVRGPAEMGQTTQRRSQAEPTAERSIASCNGDGAAQVQVGVYLRGSQRGCGKGGWGKGALATANGVLC